MIVLRKVLDKTRFKLAFQTFTNILESSVELELDIDKILNNELLHTEEIKYKTKKAIKEFKIEKKEELKNKLLFLAAANKCFEGLDKYEEEKTKLKRKHTKIVEEFKAKLKKDKKKTE